MLDAGFPIRRSMDQCLLTAPHGLSQFCHVLLRLLVPRHPPNALTSLTTKTVRPAARFAPSSLLERIKQLESDHQTVPADGQVKVFLSTIRRLQRRVILWRSPPSSLLEGMDHIPDATVDVGSSSRRTWSTSGRPSACPLRIVKLPIRMSRLMRTSTSFSRALPP